MGDLQFLLFLLVIVALAASVCFYVVVRELDGKALRFDLMEAKIGELEMRTAILEDDVDRLRWVILKRLYCSHGEEDGEETT